jgi:hypothetical protein
MAVPLIDTSFTTGEVSPSIFGHVDLARFHTAASTMRNMYVGYRGGSYSRAGTKFIGFSKQTGRNTPPRLITFQFNINQGLALEFGNFYMRVVSNGAYVIDSALSITNITQANPAVMTTVPATAGSTATPINTGISNSYAPGDTVTLAGGTYSTPMTVTITNTQVLLTQGYAPGTGYVPGDTITLAGGTASTAAVITVASTQVVSATVAAAGTGGVDGSAVVTGTTGTGAKFQASVTIAGGVITAVNGITFGGNYTVNPIVLANEPITGGGLTGAALNVQMGVLTNSVTNPGIFTANPPSGEFSQGSTSGTGSGATFHFTIMAPSVAVVTTPGVYTSFPANPVQQASTSGFGFGVQFNVVTTTAAPFNTGDWVELAGISGMTTLNGDTVVVTQITPTTYSLQDIFSNNINSTGYPAYISGGTASRIYTLPTIYAENDLEYLKFTQSADVMSICCVNQQTGTEYIPQDLSRSSDSNWTFSGVVAHPSVTPPGITAITPTDAGKVYYAYVVTSIDPNDGTESVASGVVYANKAVNIAGQAGSITITWAQVPGVTEYRIYKATPSFGSPVPSGALFGYAGTAFGTRWVDNNIVADFTQVPPVHSDPFSRGRILSVYITNGGVNYTTASAAISTSTGSGAAIAVVVNTVLTATSSGDNNVAPGPVGATIVQDGGGGYAPTDTVAITGDGSGATATLNVGPQNGTYPSVVGYFQERRVYASSLNNPDTYWMSQPGAFKNFDSRIPTISSDAITGTPWSVEVNGIQFMVSMPGGLVMLTGLSAWQLTGAGGSSLNPQPITPSSQQAQPQAYNGCSATVPPIKIDYDILYVQAKGSIYRDLAYNFYTNIYTGEDLTQNSSQLFTGYTIREHAWCEEPFKIIWAVRNDGVLLSLTFNKPQQVSGWARHDTQGFFRTACSVTEPPVDALYVGVERYFTRGRAYTIERMDDRLWDSPEEPWCVDCGLQLAQGTPDATLNVSSATGLGAINGVSGLVGGAGYSAFTTAQIVDDEGTGPGTGATVSLIISNGVIVAVNILTPGSGYTYPALVITDPEGSSGGSGASATLGLDNSATFSATSPIFAPTNVGDVIRVGGGVAVITQYVSFFQIVANIITPITSVIADGGGVQPQTSGNWTLTTPTTTISGLSHLAGMAVTGLADGNVISPQVVSSLGSITLPVAASAVTVGLGFQAQLQSVYLDVGEPTVQGKRKKIAAVTVRVEASAGMEIGSSQPDGSLFTPMRINQQWSQMTPVDIRDPRARKPYLSNTPPLYTGDTRCTVYGGYQTPGQVAIQQPYPLPMQVLAFIPEILVGDNSETQAQQKQRRGGPPQQGAPG